MGEYRRYFKEHNRGWYLGANIGMMAFDMSKPYIEGWKLKFEDRYCKGYGMMIGLCVGYEYQFGKRWLLDAFLGWAWMDSHYNGYSFDGQRLDRVSHLHAPQQTADSGRALNSSCRLRQAAMHGKSATPEPKGAVLPECGQPETAAGPGT